MPSKANYTGGYSEFTASKLARVQLPAKLCCFVCKKWRNNEGFSKAQLADLRYKIAQFGNVSIGSGHAKCRECTGQQNTEMRCVLCDTTKALSEFSHNQRRTPDDARCKACQYDREKPKLEPGHAGRAEDVEVEEDDSDDGSEPSNPYDEGSSIWATEDGTESEGGAPLPPSINEPSLSRTLTNMSLTNSQAGDRSAYIDRATGRPFPSAQPQPAHRRTTEWVNAGLPGARLGSLSSTASSAGPLSAAPSSAGGMSAAGDWAGPATAKPRPAMSNKRVSDDPRIAGWKRWSVKENEEFGRGGTGKGKEPAHSAGGSSKHADLGTAFHAFDPQGMEHIRYRAPSPTASTATAGFRGQATARYGEQARSRLPASSIAGSLSSPRFARPEKLAVVKTGESTKWWSAKDSEPYTVVGDSGSEESDDEI